jgi:hypothetical protein
MFHTPLSSKKKLPFPSPRRRGQGEVGEGLGVRAVHQSNRLAIFEKLHI